MVRTKGAWKRRHLLMVGTGGHHIIPPLFSRRITFDVRLALVRSEVCGFAVKL